MSQVSLGALAVLALLPACGARRSGPTVAEAPLARRLLALPGELRVEGAGEPGEAARRLEELAATARAALDRRGGRSAVDVLNTVVFDEQGWRREVDDQDLPYVLLPSALRERRGSCVGLGTLYLALGELLRLPLRGVVEYDVGNELRRRGRVADARRAFERAVAHFPSLPEAQASLGAVLQLAGALGPALAAYQAAERLAPDLPGLRRNRHLLDEELHEEREEKRAADPRVP